MSTAPGSSTGHENHIAFGCYQSKDAYSSVKHALGLGYRRIDTARVYKNENAVGRAVQEKIAEGMPRKEIYTTSKVNAREHNSKDTPKAIRQSLNRTGLEYLDCYLLHDAISGKERRIQAYKCLLEAQDKGQIRSVGVSNWNVTHMKQLLEENLPLPVVNQIEVHPWCQQREIVAFCQSSYIQVEAYCPLVRGERMQDSILLDIAQESKRTPAQVLVRWSIQKGFIPVVKSDTPSRIEENFSVNDFKLSEKQMAGLDSLDMGDEGACSWNPVNVA